MSVRARPDHCCEVPRAALPMGAHERRRWQAAFRALGDPTRLDIVLLLAGQEAPLCACDVIDSCQVSQPTVSHHMKVLAQAGLVDASRQGIWAYYALSDQGRAVVELMRATAPPERTRRTSKRHRHAMRERAAAISG